MSAADDDARIATLDEERPTGLVGCLSMLGMLFALHVWMTVNVAIALGGLTALVYALLPPYAVFAMLGWALDYWRLSLPAILIWLVLLAGLWRIARRTGPHRPIEWCVFLPVLLLWMPLLSADLVRAAAMHHALYQTRSDCHGTRHLMGSMHTIHGESFRPRHAWMIKDGQRYLWSYRTMAFEPDPHPLAWGPVCRP